MGTKNVTVLFLTTMKKGKYDSSGNILNSCQIIALGLINNLSDPNNSLLSYNVL